MFSFPPERVVPAEQRARGPISLRYEDIAEDGSLKVLGMPHAVGEVCFRDLWHASELGQSTRAAGVLPILYRLVMQTTGGPISTQRAVEVDGCYELAHTVDSAGAVDRILLSMTANLHGPASRTHDPQPANAGERVHLGRVYAEHVFTRPFRAAPDRKVMALDRPEGPFVPSRLATVSGVHDVLDTPEGTRWLDDGLMLDPVPVVFGLTHTDSNQHVNSLVYPQLFEDAALRRLHMHGRSTNSLLVDHIEILFRKPCFSGERVSVWLRCFEHQGRVGAVGYLSEREGDPSRSRTVFRLVLRGNCPLRPDST